MTPLAAQLFRHGSSDQRAILAGAQFFECSALQAMADEMGQADVEAGRSEYSMMAQLPAPVSVFEASTPSGRYMLIAEQQGDEIYMQMWLQLSEGPVPSFRWASGFTLGTARNAEVEWATYGDEPKVPLVPGDDRHNAALGFNLRLEKMLLIINQRGLVEQHAEPTDKRVIRTAMAEGHDGVAAIWHRCRIRPGTHGSQSGDGEARETQLHYVRKHFKPSRHHWVDGYWRGNADLGVHLKTYVAHAPTTPVSQLYRSKE